MNLFDHDRTRADFSDPNNIIRDSGDAGLFQTNCGDPTGPAELLAALERNGRMPVNDAAHGIGTSQAVIAAVSGVVILFGIGLSISQLVIDDGHVARAAIGIITVILGAIVFTAAIATILRRRKQLTKLYEAWDNGWLRFAPARVGGAWLHRTHRVKGQERANKLGNEDVEHYFKVLVSVYPTDGIEPFTFESEEFRALADADGNPRELIVAPTPLDATEPEFSNGWTVVRYVSGFPEKSATLSTNLNEDQITEYLTLSRHSDL